jgi:hypothetical protein
VIRDLAAAKEFDRIKKIIQQLCNDFAYAVHQPHARNGGLIGLAAAAIALGPVSQKLCIFETAPLTVNIGIGSISG